MARNVQTLYRPICHPTGNARQEERRHPFGWAQPQKSNLKSPGSHSQHGIHQAEQCQHPSPPAAGAHASRPRLLTPQDGALLGRLQNQTFRLAGLASRRKLFLLYSRKRHWKTLITYQRRCRAWGRSPWLLEAFISASPGLAPPRRLRLPRRFGMAFKAAAVDRTHNRWRAKPDHCSRPGKGNAGCCPHQERGWH